jgi:hypothetical protein
MRRAIRLLYRISGGDRNTGGTVEDIRIKENDMNIDTILYTAAFVCLLLDAFGVLAGVKWFSLAAALLVLSLLV